MSEHARTGGRVRRPATSIAVGGATAIVVLALAVAPFLNPAWVSFERGRSGAAEWTGFSPIELRAATDAILSDLVLGPPDFAVEIRGQPVLTPAERGHMADVRRVFLAFGLVALASAAVLLVAHRRAGPAFWRAVRGGAIGLGAAIVFVGIAGLLAFDVVFEAFHRLFFAGGNYTFDPTVDRLVQLFPYQFWVETSFAVGAVAIAIAAVTAWLAGRRLGSGATQAALLGRPAEVTR